MLNIIYALEELKKHKDILSQDIYNKFKTPIVDLNTFTKYILTSIEGFIIYFKSNYNKKIFYKISFDILNEVGVEYTNLAFINHAFNFFIIESYKYIKKLLQSEEIFEFIKAQNLFLISFADYYHKRVTELLNLERKRIEILNEKILQSMNAGLLVLDNDLKILKTNRAFHKIANLNGDITGKNLKDIFRDREGIPIDILREKCLKEKGLGETEINVIRKDGKKYTRKLKAEILYNNKGEREGFIVHVSDIEYVKYIQEQFSRYLSHQIAQKILNEKDIKLDGEKREIAVMFVDIRGFTKFAEKNTPEKVLQTLNEYMSIIIDIVFNYRGTLDKFIGDAVMVVFGAPIQGENDIVTCIKCAIDIQKSIKKFNRTKKEPLFLGIGINFGEAISGNVGSNKRVEYTVIGDTVNIAERVQQITPGGKIFITENVINQLTTNDNFNINFVKKAILKGKTTPLNIYQVNYL